MTVRACILLALFPIIVSACFSSPGSPPPAPDPSLEWAVPPGFALEKMNGGFHLVTGIAFVPQPGPEPGDVRLFVGELNGVIKAVTNDGQVIVFSDDFSALGGTEFVAEYGVSGLCLAPEEGYVFVTWNEYTASSIRINRIARFRAQPGTFGAVPLEIDFLPEAFFEGIRVFGNHQIGACDVHDGSLYVSVGDALQEDRSRDNRSFLGKVLRFDLDFNPAPGNPFPINNDLLDYSEYVWVSGLRNPFALEVMPDGRLFVGDNGIALDRFLELTRGGDYGYDGTDTSIGVNPIFAFYPAVGPSGLEYAPSDYEPFPPEYRGQFYLASVGSSYLEGGGGFNVRPGILRLQVNLQTGKATAVPDYLLQFVGAGQGLVGLALGPDGLYFSPFLPEDAEGSGLYRLRYDPANPHPVSIDEPRYTNIPALLTNLGCQGCHTMRGTDTLVGPSLDPVYLSERLDRRLNSSEYLEALDALDRAGYGSPEQWAARESVRAAQGDERLRVWVESHLAFTGFDNPNTLMPNPGLTADQIEIISEYLLNRPTWTQWLKQRMLLVYPAPRHRDLVFAFLLGSGAGALVLHLARTAARRRS